MGKYGSEDQIKFFYKDKYLGSCDPDYFECDKLYELIKSDSKAATQVLNYMNSLGDPVFPTEEDEYTPETDVSKVDTNELYNLFMQELYYYYSDFPEDFYVGGDYLLPDFEIFVGPVAEDNVVSSTKIKASRYDNVPGYKAPKGGYLYIFKHGIGPGTMPKDVEIIKTKDLPNYYTAVWLSDFLTTDELKKYDIPDETRINSILDRIGYCQKNGDVVPCDDSNTWEGYSLDACDDIMAATTSNRYTIKSVSDEGTFYLVKDWRKNRELWVIKDRMDSHPDWWFTSSGKAKQSLKSLLSVMDDYLSDTFTVVDMSGNETPLDVKDLGFTHIPIYDTTDVDKTKLVRQVIKQAKEIRDYFQSHNNNLNHKQEQYLEDLSDGIDNESVAAIRDAIENMKYNSKNLRSEQYNLIMDLYDEFNLAGGKYQGMGYPEDDEVNACGDISCSTKVSAASNYDTKLIAKWLKAKFDDEAFGTAYTMHRISDADAYMGRNGLTYNRKNNTIDLWKSGGDEDIPIYKVVPQYSSTKRQGTYAPKMPKLIPIDEWNATHNIEGSTKPEYFADMVSASDDGADESEWYDWWNDVDGYLMGWDKEFKQLIYDFRNKNGWPKDIHDPLCDKLADVVYEYVRTHLDKLDIDPSENDDSDYREFAGERMIDWLLEDPAAYDFWADYKD